MNWPTEGYVVKKLLITHLAAKGFQETQAGFLGEYTLATIPRLPAAEKSSNFSR